jgi:acyl-CoA synthetase (AMP-forming)/AMP-acid ligase II
MNFATLTDLLQSRAAHHGERRAYTFLADGEREIACWSYGELDAKARAIAANLAERAAPGDRVMLAYPPGLDFVAAFFGCLYAGAIAVPVPLPHPRRGHDRLDAIAEDCTPRVLASTAAGFAALAAVAERSPHFAAMAKLVSDDCADDDGLEWAVHGAGPGDLALLQYTSGSTSAPKGVRVSHGNVLANLAMIHEAEGNDEASRGLSWLPAYHDMGLIEGVLEPLYGCYPTWLMSAGAFLQRPLRWLDAISEYGATVSGAPDFAYDLCVKRVLDEELEALDLSSWQVAYNGAEPVRADTLDAFCARFARCGFSARAVRPVYGLAEATALVSASARDRDAPHVLGVAAADLEQGRVAAAGGNAQAVRLVSCGAAPTGTAILIMDTASPRELPPGRVGEVCVRGPSVASGYWGVDEGEGRTFAVGADGSRWLRTGDLGFVCDGELYVTGRIKDLIIMRGRKLYPHDIERTVEACDARVCPSGVAAFAVRDAYLERLVVVAEVEAPDPADLQPVVDAIAEAVFRDHECAVAATILVRRGVLPRTSSGKLMRFRCREDYLANRLPGIVRLQGPSGGERRVA